MRQEHNYEVRDDNIPCGKGLEKLFDNNKTNAQRVDEQLGGNWLDTHNPSIEKKHRWIVRDHAAPSWGGVEYKDKEQAYKALARMGRSCYIFHYIPTEEEWDDDRRQKNADNRFRMGIGA